MVRPSIAMGDQRCGGGAVARNDDTSAGPGMGPRGGAEEYSIDDDDDDDDDDDGNVNRLGGGGRGGGWGCVRGGGMTCEEGRGGSLDADEKKGAICGAARARDA